MPIGVAFIRGINVGGRNSLPMETLRTLCEGLGLLHATTYNQSGNVAFVAKARQAAAARVQLEDAIERERGFRASVAVRTIDELREVAGSSPFAARKGIDEAKALVMFLTEKPAASAGAAAKLATLPAKPGDVQLIGREAYLYFDGGVSGSKLTMPAVERAVATPGTCRNWKTVLKVLTIAEALERKHG